MPAFYEDLTRRNRRMTRLLLAGAFLLLMLLVGVFAGLLFGPQLLTDPVRAVAVTAAGAGVGLALTYASYRSGPALALRAARARQVSREQEPQLHRLLDEVCVSAGLSTPPKLYLVEDPAPNAFATGLSPENSHVAVTTGLVERLPRYELRAVLAHEVAHIVNDDVRTVTVAVATVGLVALLSELVMRVAFASSRGRRSSSSGGAGAAQVVLLLIGLVAVVLAPLAAQMIRFAVSRQREYLADATAAEMLRDPQSMVDALRRLEQDSTPLQRFETANAHLWFEEPNATKGKDRGARRARRFATHPPLSDRVERLSQLNAGHVDPNRPLRHVEGTVRDPE